MKATVAIMALVVTIALAGCTSQPKVMKVPPPPPAPPAPPPVRAESINRPLRELATREIRLAANSDNPLMRSNAVEAAELGLGASGQDLIANALNDKDA